jgi:hypothetical protein
VRRALLFRSWRTAAYVVVAVGVVAFTLCARGAPWRGEWAWTFDWVAGSSIILGPLYAGMTGFETADGQPFDAALARPTARRTVLATLAPLGGPTLAVLGAYLLGVGAATVVASRTAPTDDLQPVVVVLGALLLLVFGLSGLVVGQYLPRTAAGLAAWLGGLAVTIASAGIAVPHLFRIGASTGSLAGMGVWWRGAGSHLLAYLLLGGLVVLVATQRWRSRPHRLALWGLVAAFLVVVGVIAHDDRLYQPLAHPRWVCSGSASSVRACMLAGNSAQLSAWHDGLAALTSTLSLVGATPAATYRQPAPGASVGSGEALLLPDPQRVNISPPTVGQVADAVARPTDCPQFHAEVAPVGALAAQHWLSEFLAQRAQPRASADRDLEVLQWMAGSSAHAQDAWARATYVKLRTCSLTGMDAPAGG